MRFIMKKQYLYLVVDNDPGVQNLTRDILELYGHTVLTAGSRGEALSVLERQRDEIGVVLLDVMASETATIDACRRIREINPAAKIIITSVYSQDHDAARVFGQNAAGYLKKPYRMSELLKTVELAQSRR